MSDIDRFLYKVNEHSGKFYNGIECWEWTGTLDPYYGSFWYDGKPGKAHRFSYQYHKGLIPSGFDVHHQCENKICVNPAHLEILDKALHAKLFNCNAKKTHCPKGHKYTEENTYHNPKGGKACKICKKDNVRRFSHYQGGIPYKERTHCPKNHPYDKENTYISPNDPNHRICRQCKKESYVKSKIHQKSLETPINSRPLENEF